MKIGVLTVLLGGLEFPKALDYLKKVGVEAVEVGCGGYPGNAHCKPTALLRSRQKTAEFKEAITSRGLTLSALSMHGNPLHPNREIAEQHLADQRNAILLAEKLELDTVVTFSGCPGDRNGAKYPNWATCAWPTDYQDILTWQWQKKVIPFWKEEVAFAKDHGVTKIALEMHPGFVVYNPETLFKLRDAVGPEIGANYDPSHLFWQGIDVPESIVEVGKAGALFHFHAKDSRVEPAIARRYGVLDAKPYTDELRRAWMFRTVGYGNPMRVWKDIVSALRLVGYDGALSIEHEDSLMSPNEGLEKAVQFLKSIVIREPRGQAYWA